MEIGLIYYFSILIFIMIYPIFKKGLQEVILDTTSVLLIPIGLIINIVKNKKVKKN